MPWARLDDSVEGHRKVRRAGLEATGLWARAIAYCARYLTDGRIDDDWLEAVIPSRANRRRVIDQAVEAGLFDQIGEEIWVHDYLDFNPSRAEVEERREKERAKKRRQRAEYPNMSPGDGPGDSPGDSPGPSRDPIPTPTPHAEADASSIGPIATVSHLPLSATSTAAVAISERDRHEREFEDWLAELERVAGHPPPREGTKARAARLAEYQARRDEGWTATDLRAAIHGAWGDDYRRENGYTTAQSILRPTKVDSLVARGRNPAVGSKQSRTVALLADLDRIAAGGAA